MLILLAVAAIAAVLLVVLCETFLRYALKAGVSNTGENLDPLFTGEENRRERQLTRDWLDSECREVWTMSRDRLRLHGWTFDQGARKWVITMHGYKGDELNNGTFARDAAAAGWNVLVINDRGHGKSGGKWLSMGKWESEDLLEWVGFIRDHDPGASICLHGVSMGGATVMMAAGENPEGVRCVIEDCGYSTLTAEYETQLRDILKLPVHPLLDLIGFWCRVRLGFSFGEVDPLAQVAKTENPMLFIHGGADTYVPWQMVHEVYGACKAEKELWIPEDTPHAASMCKWREEYSRRCLEFMEKHI